MIDDDPDIVFTLRVGLESDPTMQVFGFDNPVTALVEFKPNFYDLLLIDINMPLEDFLSILLINYVGIHCILVKRVNEKT